MASTVLPLFESHRSCSSASRHSGVAGKMCAVGLLLIALLVALVFASTAQAQAGPPNVLLGTADGFAVLAGSTITNTGPTVINGDLGLHPGTVVTGFPPGTVNGAQHVADAVAQQAKTDLVTAYNDAAGRPNSGTLPPDAGGQTLTAGVYRTGSVPSLGLTGNLTLDAQGVQGAVFIFQVASTLTTATASSVTLINGAQACNVYWQVGSDATLGTTSAFKGNILATRSISVNNGVNVAGRLLARNGALTLINDTVTRSQCAAAPAPGPAPTPGPAPAPGPAARPDVTGPRVRISGVAGGCVARNFTARVRVSDSSGIRSVSVFLDGRRVRRTSRTRFSLRIEVRGLRVGRHRIRVVAVDRAGNRRVRTRSFRRCAPALPAPRFTG
jgi:hypothetical protein